jgi:hypothetical protein
MVRTGAIKFSSPIETPATAMPRVNQVPRRGASLAPLPFPSQRKRRGKMASRARTGNTLGAPRMLPIALDRVASQTPSKIASPQMGLTICLYHAGQMFILSANNDTFRVIVLPLSDCGGS